VYGEGQRRPLTEHRRRAVDRLCGRLWREGHRLLAVAYQTADGMAAMMTGSSLTLAGFLVFDDPPKVGVADTLRRLTARGVRTVIITGDAAPAAAALCESIGLPAGRPVTGAQTDRLDESALTALCADTVVFAEVDPVQKARVIRALRGRGHTVGYLGDGINDVAPLRAADVGICVAGGIGVARQAADVVLLGDDLAVLERGLVEGRRATVNASKYLKATLSSNLGNVFSLLLAGAFLPFLPMLPIQLLSQNLCYDLVQLALPFDRTDPEQLQRPHRWSPRDLIGFITCFGLLSSLFDIATFALLGRHLAAADPASRALFHTGWFVGNLLTQILAVQVIRTARVPILGSRASTTFTLATVAGCGLAVLIPHSPAAALLGLRPLPPAVLVALIVVGAGYLVSLQGAKVLYRRATGRWL
jgi:Mg2+-importing ATPase